MVLLRCIWNRSGICIILPPVPRLAQYPFVLSRPTFLKGNYFAVNAGGIIGLSVAYPEITGTLFWLSWLSLVVFVLRYPGLFIHFVSVSDPVSCLGPSSFPLGFPWLSFSFS